MNLNHRKKPTYTSEEIRLYCKRVARNFWGHGRFLKIRAKILIFLFTLQWASFQGLQFDCDLLFLINILVCTTTDDAGIELDFLEALKTQFRCSLKANIKEIEYASRTWRFGNRGFHPVAPNLYKGDHFIKYEYHIQIQNFV